MKNLVIYCTMLILLLFFISCEKKDKLIFEQAESAFFSGEIHKADSLYSIYIKTYPTSQWREIAERQQQKCREIKELLVEALVLIDNLEYTEAQINYYKIIEMNATAVDSTKFFTLIKNKQKEVYEKKKAEELKRQQEYEKRQAELARIEKKRKKQAADLAIEIESFGSDLTEYFRAYTDITKFLEKRLPIIFNDAQITSHNFESELNKLLSADSLIDAKKRFFENYEKVKNPTKTFIPIKNNILEAKNSIQLQLLLLENHKNLTVKQFSVENQNYADTAKENFLEITKFLVRLAMDEIFPNRYR